MNHWIKKRASVLMLGLVLLQSLIIVTTDLTDKKMARKLITFSASKELMQKVEIKHEAFKKSGVAKEYNHNQLSDSLQNEIIYFLNELEMFATAIDANVYDFDVYNQIFGTSMKGLVNHYDESILKQRKKSGNPNQFAEIKKLISRMN